MRYPSRVAVALSVVGLSAATVAGSFAAGGDHDPTFSVDGKATTHFEGGDNFVGGVAIQANGKVVVVGGAEDRAFDRRVALVRFLANGTLDPRFGGDGKVTTNLTRGRNDRGAFAVALQANGKIVVAGGVDGAGGRFAVVRFNHSGTLDKTFSDDGKTFTDFTPGGADYARGIAIQGDGRIVVVGRAGGFGGRFAAARYNLNGTLDSSFNATGKVMTDFTTANDEAHDVAIQADGKIVVTGAAAWFSYTAESNVALARFNPDGTPDASFDGDGKVTTDFPGDSEWATGVAIQADGKIVTAGDSGQTLRTSDSMFALARYNEDGTPDLAFDGDGQVTTDFTDWFDGAWGGVAIQLDGKIVAAGHAAFIQFALARYEPNGTLDATFSGDGKVTTKFGNAGEIANGVAIQSDGKIVAAGTSGENRRFAAVRYLGE